MLDITLLRLNDTGAELDPIGARADRIRAGLRRASLLSPYTKTVVYYDGPDSQGRPTVCGQGGGQIAAPKHPGSRAHRRLRPAPGNYVLVKAQP